MKTKVIFNNLIPFKGFMAVCLWPFILVRSQSADDYSAVTNNHEHIHIRQQKEMLIVGMLLAVIAFVAGLGLWGLLLLPIFFWWYVLEWLCRLVQYRDTYKAYRNISFEREAYANEKDMAYNGSRKPFTWFRYLHKK